MRALEWIPSSKYTLVLEQQAYYGQETPLSRREHALKMLSIASSQMLL